MFKLLFRMSFLFVMLVAGMIAYFMGWIGVQKNEQGGSTTVSVTVNSDKFANDKNAVMKLFGEKRETMHDKIDELRRQSRGLSGTARAEADRKIDELVKQEQALDAKIKEFQNTSVDKIDGVKNKINGAFDDLARNLGLDSKKTR